MGREAFKKALAVNRGDHKLEQKLESADII